jgi:hypothetical protein
VQGKPLTTTGAPLLDADVAGPGRRGLVDDRSCLAENIIKILTFTEISSTLSTLGLPARGSEEIERVASVRGAIWGLEKAFAESGRNEKAVKRLKTNDPAKSLIQPSQ